MANQQVDETTSKTICDFIQQYLLSLQKRTQVSLTTIIRKSDITFSSTVVTEQEISIENIHSSQSETSSSADTSLLIIYGMNKSSEDDAGHVSLTWSPGFLPSSDSEHGGIGTVWISGRHFIYSILEVLGEFNSKTTLVRQNDSDIFVTLWDRKDIQKKQWMLDEHLTANNPQCQVYSWHYRYDLTRREEGSHIKHTWNSLVRKYQNTYISPISRLRLETFSS